MTLRLLLGFKRTPTKLGSCPNIKSSLLEFTELLRPGGGHTPVGNGGTASLLLVAVALELVPPTPLPWSVKLLPLPVGCEDPSVEEGRKEDFSLGAPAAARCAIATWFL